MIKKDIIASLVLLGISALFWIQTESFTKYGALFPQTVIIILGFLSLLLLITSIIRMVKNKSKENKVEKIQDVKSIIISIILIIVWAFFIKILGFLTSSIIFFILMYLLLLKRGIRTKKIIINVFTIIISIVIFYVFFSRVLKVPFPAGILI